MIYYQLEGMVHRTLLVHKLFTLARDLPLEEIPFALREMSVQLAGAYGVPASYFLMAENCEGKLFEVISQELNPTGWVIGLNDGILRKARSRCLEGPLAHGRVVRCTQVAGDELFVVPYVQPL